MSDDNKKRKRRVRRVRRPSDTSPEEKQEEKEAPEEEESKSRTPEVEVSNEDQEKEAAKEPEVEVVEPEPEIPMEQRGKIVVRDNPLMDIVEMVIDRGKSVVISRGQGDHFLIHAEDESEFSMGKAKTMEEYYKEVQTEEYLEWLEKWASMSNEEKLAFVKEEGVEWEYHETPRIDSMRMAQAAREHMGIEKYKDKYSTRSSRRQVKPRK